MNISCLLHCKAINFLYRKTINVMLLHSGPLITFSNTPISIINVYKPWFSVTILQQQFLIKWQLILLQIRCLQLSPIIIDLYHVKWNKWYMIWKCVPSASFALKKRRGGDESVYDFIVDSVKTILKAVFSMLQHFTHSATRQTFIALVKD